MDCPRCGASITADANFCPACGTDLRGDVTAVMPRHDEDDPVEATVGGDDPTIPPEEEIESTRAIPMVTEPPADALSLVRCPSCDAPNSAARPTCGRCGVDLRTGEPAPDEPEASVPSRDTTPANVPVRAMGDTDAAVGPPTWSGQRTSDRRWLVVLAIVAGGILLGGTAGALVAFDVGPFGAGQEEPDVPAPPFDDQAYSSDPRALPIAAIGASTVQQPSGGNTYDPQLMLDDDPATAWNSDGDVVPDGVGEKVSFDFGTPVWLTEITILNGYQKDEARYTANARLSEILLRFDGGESFVVSLADDQAPQRIPLPAPVLTTAAQIEVLEVYPGDRYRDLAISEITFTGWQATGEDAEIGEQRSDLLAT